MRLFAALLVTAALALAHSGTADAHAFLRHAVPLVGSTIPTAPAFVTLDYSEALEPRFSSIKVQDAHGTRVDKGDVHVAPNNPKQLIVSLSPLPPGTYSVEWRVLSVDTHHTEGNFTFTVRP
jgi:methionine-rich copper-binding protein CopC